ncbi:MAG: hypothetical protein AMXMBFR53_44430 [Gemmatimonadota bacterium]
MSPDGQATSVLYVSYDGLLEPLGSSQVLPYLRALARRGYAMRVLSFEKAADLERGPAVAALRDELAAEGIGWEALRYHKRPSLPATAWDVAAGRRRVAAWARRARLHGGRAGLVHARGYVAGLMGLAGRGAGARLLFDMRGFWVDERIAGGYWSPGGLPARVGRWAERRLLDRSDHLVLLTRRGGDRVAELASGGAPPPWSVVPTCVDVTRFRPPGDAAAVRRELGVGPAPVLLHIGTLTGWYDGRLTMEVGRAWTESTGGSFVVLTRQTEEARRLAREAGVDALVRYVEPAEIPRWLQAGDAGLALPRVSPSKDASFPTKIAEYLACGLAVLATPIGDVPDYADDGSLRLFGGRDDVKDAVAWLASAARDPERGARARAVAEARLGVESGADVLERVYRSLGVEPRR